MAQNRTYLGLQDVTLEGEELCREAAQRAAWATSRRRLRLGNKSVLSVGEDRRIILAAYKQARERAAQGLELPQAMECLLDDLYVAEKALTCLRDEDPGAWRGLPCMAQGERLGLPRVYDMAVCLIGHRAGRLEESMLARFLEAFQGVSPLKLAELCALPAMLRIALVKLIALECEGALDAMGQYAQAEALAAQAGKGNPQREREAYLHKPYLAARLFGLLSEAGEQGACSRMLRRLEQADLDLEALCANLQREDSIRGDRLRHAIKSLRTLDAMDWEKCCEGFSLVDRALREDNAYPGMDARSRAWYRRRVECLAAKLGVAETVVARQAVALGKARQEQGGRVAQAGYYLLEEGQRDLYAILRPDKRCRLRSEARKLWRFWILQGALLAGLLYLCGATAWYQGLLALLPAWSLAAGLSVRLFLARSQPSMLPRMEYKDALPPEQTTLVVVPALITDAESLRGVIRQLEVHMLATRMEHCYYGVLGDFPDGKQAQRPGEGELLRLAKSLVEELNQKYPSPTPLFYYLHRRRTYQKADGLYMGWERKRGALCQLVTLLTQGDATPFALLTHPLPQGIRYCLTLDADTVLPPGALAKLVGAMAHPLHAPEWDDQGVVRKGYGILAPRMAALPRGAAKSGFAWVASGDSGLDSYFPLCGEFYQDVFGAGIFGGKGIFHVEAFARALPRWIPENQVLSHDLLEGCFLRAGLVEDVTLYDCEPAGFIAWWKRQHRWTRGDWQLLPYLAEGVRDGAGVLRDNPLSSLSRYKIFDNLRRSLTPLGALACLAALPYLGWGWYGALALLCILEGPVLEAVCLPVQLLRSRRPVRFGGALLDRMPGAARAALDLMVLPYGTARLADAQVRTLYRVGHSHKHMLQWQTAAQTRGKPGSLGAYYSAMWPQTAVGLLMLAGMALGHAPWISGLLGVLWLAAPWGIERLDRGKAPQPLSPRARELLLDIARRTWAFFDGFAGPETGWLPPDNYQQAPARPVVANTSPTNIGMGMIACVCAMDLGFLTGEQLCRRIGNMLDTLEGLETWRGHFYNWYSLWDRRVLSPRYVSTVDSGNLAACLLTTAAALEALPGETGRAQGKRCRAMAKAMDFCALYDRERGLFHIGFDEGAGRLSRAWYDLMASESRLTSLVAVALGQVEAEHWFHLGRLLVPAGGGRALLSWSGTMFEYLMPVLFTGLVPGTLLHEGCVNALQAQIRYGQVQGFPWGISESGYYAFDRAMYYQYRAFGVPQLGLMAQREPSRVVSPYSTLLALGVPGWEEKVLANLERLVDEGALGEYGMLEALDYTGSRVAAGKEREMVQSYMAHHQGMGLCALTNCLCGDSIRRRFMALPEIRAVEILLEEKPPAHGIVIREFESAALQGKAPEKKPHRPRRVTGPKAVPETQLLSNGDYTLFLTDSGLGFSKWRDVLLTRWRPDPLRGDGGIHLMARLGEETWELTWGAETILHPHKVEFHGRRGPLSTHVETYVCPQLDGEIREITLGNHGEEKLEVELGVFGEVCLATAEEDMAHPAFVRLTVEAAQQEGMLLFWRRQGGGAKPKGVLYAQLYAQGLHPRYCTDRLSARGRGATLGESMRRPLGGGPAEAPVDPCIAARATVSLEAGQSQTLWFLMGYAPNGEKALAQAKDLRAGLGEWEELAWAHALSDLRMAGLSEGKAELFQRMAARLLLQIPQKPKRPKDAPLGPGLEGLWQLGISGDLPILLMEVESLQGLRMARTLLEFSSYMAAQNCPVDLVLVGCYPHAYRGELQLRLGELCSRHPQAKLLHGYALPQEQRQLLRDMALVVADGKPGRSLDKQFAQEEAPSWPPQVLTPGLEPMGEAALPPLPPLAFANGFGGLDMATGAYVIQLGPGEKTPMPWCNILTNGSFGALVSESGGGYTFGKNSRTDKLTPWQNEPLSDRRGEILLLWDGQEGHRPFTIEPGRLQREPARVRHGYGYTAFSTTAYGLNCEAVTFIDPTAPVKYTLLTLENPGEQERRLQLLYQAEWVLGERGDPASIYAYTYVEAAFARSLRTPQSPPGYLACPTLQVQVCHDREALLKGGWWAESLPEAPRHYGGAMSGLRGDMQIPAGGRVQVVLMLGQEAEAEAAERISRSTPSYVAERLQRVEADWQARLGKIRVQTPHPDFDALINGRLLYQVYAARLMARTGYYQCSGAMGFRDQLQDMLALLQVEPARVREQLLLCAGRQFPAGDVLHWWHMPMRGVRTRIVDDRLFLPYVLSYYLETTQDMDILDVPVAYLADRPLAEGQRDLYDRMEPGEAAEPLYGHCMRAIRSASRFGAHGLPYMEGGDWNDGMDQVGQGGGESVWLGWFLLAVYRRFAPIARAYGRDADAEELEGAIPGLQAALEAAWDGAWYRRAYFADGTPLGSASNHSCRIDCISQAWAAICGGEHGAEAMDALMEMLLDSQSGILRLLTPAFREPMEQGNPVGYITAYVPGVRENGGQYTHGAAWAVWACCRLGRSEEAFRLFETLNPLVHTSTRTGAVRYGVEPYALAGDVYAPPNGGRGGWSWYTGAAAWLYKIGLEDMLGIRRQGQELCFAPCVPFDSFAVTYAFGSATYVLRFQRGEKKGPKRIALLDDGKCHTVKVVF